MFFFLVQYHNFTSAIKFYTSTEISSTFDPWSKLAYITCDFSRYSTCTMILSPYLAERDCTTHIPFYTPTPSPLKWHHFLPRVSSCFRCCSSKPSRWSARLTAASYCCLSWARFSSFFRIAVFTLTQKREISEQYLNQARTIWYRVQNNTKCGKYVKTSNHCGKHGLLNASEQFGIFMESGFNFYGHLLRKPQT